MLQACRQRGLAIAGLSFVSLLLPTNIGILPGNFSPYAMHARICPQMTISFPSHPFFVLQGHQRLLVSKVGCAAGR